MWFPVLEKSYFWSLNVFANFVMPYSASLLLSGLLVSYCNGLCPRLFRTLSYTVTPVCPFRLYFQFAASSARPCPS